MPRKKKIVEIHHLLLETMSGDSTNVVLSLRKELEKKTLESAHQIILLQSSMHHLLSELDSTNNTWACRLNLIAT